MDSNRARRRRQQATVCGALITLLFVVDLLLPLQLVLAALYLLLMWWGGQMGRRQYHWGVAIGVTLVMAVDLWLHRSALISTTDALIQLVALVSVWLAAVLGESRWRAWLIRAASPEGKFEALLESAPDAMIFVDSTGLIRMANQQVEVLFGYSQADLIGQPIDILVPELLRERHRQHMATYFEAPRKRGMAADLDLLARRKDGSSFPVEICLSPLTTNGDLWVTAAVRDISEQKAREQELMRMNSELENFAYVASHDLKAPLRVIDNASRWLIEDLGDSLDGENLENLQLLRQRAQRMEQFLDDLLEYSRVGRRMDERYSERLPARELFDAVVFMLDPPETFTLQAEGDWDGISLFRMPMQHILANLVGNAIKHHDKGRGLIRVGIRDCDDHYRFTVTDDGPGIDPCYHDKIFEMFQTLQSRDRVEGSGMGLAIVKKILDTFGGEITVTSALGEGCTFTVKWPKEQKPLPNKGEHR